MVVVGGLRGIRTMDVGLLYAALVLIGTVAVALMPADMAAHVVQSSSTNLLNLRDHPPFVLAVSALTLSGPWELWILVPLAWVLGVVQRWLGRAATVVTVVLGHIGATLFVATILAAGIAKGRVALSEATATDVGVSYGLVAALGVLSARTGGRPRVVYTCGITVALCVLVAIGRSFTDLGHLVAWFLGLALAVLVTGARRAEHLEHLEHLEHSDNSGLAGRVTSGR